MTDHAKALAESLRPFAQQHAWGPDTRFEIVVAGPIGSIRGSDLDRARAALAAYNADQAKKGMSDV